MANYNWNQQNARANAFRNNFNNFWPLVEDREFYKTYPTERLQERLDNDPVFFEINEIRKIINAWFEGFENDIPE